MSDDIAPTGRKKRGCLWFGLGAVGVIVLLVVVVLRIRGTRAAAGQPGGGTVAVSRGSIVTAVLGSGTINPNQSLDVSFQTTGVVSAVLVREGQTVKAGDVLATLDDRSLRLSVDNAEANLRSAEARLQQVKEGNATPQDIAASEASLSSAEANLQKTVTGNVTAADIAASEASVASAEANLRKAQTGNVTAADIANAEASVRSAQAKVDDLKAGPKPEKVSSAQATLDQANTNLQQIEDNDSRAKTDAELARDTAANAVRNAQDDRAKIYWDTHNGDGGWKKGESDPGYQDDVNTYNAALRAEEDAQTKLQQAQVAYDNAVQQEINDIASAEAKVRDAETQLSVVQQGATALEITQAEASLDQAKANLANLKNGGTTYDVAAAQASLNQARANLQKLRQGGTAAEIQAAKAGVTQSEANLEKLTAPATDTDIEIQAASVDQASQSLATAKLQLDYATLRAPFDGVVTAVTMVPGGSSAAATIHLLDRSGLYVQMNLSESDVAKVAVGQPVNLAIDALESWTAKGEIGYISPVAETVNGVVIYRVTIPILPLGTAPDPRVRVGMTVNVGIVTSEKKDVLLVPNAAVLPKGEGHVVQVSDGAGGVREIPVTTGATDGTSTEILGGLKEGDTILAIAGAGTTNLGAQRTGPFGGGGR